MNEPLKELAVLFLNAFIKGSAQAMAVIMTLVIGAFILRFYLEGK